MSDEYQQHDLSPSEVEEFWRRIRPQGSREFLGELGRKLLLKDPMVYFQLNYIAIALIDLSKGKTVREAFNMPKTGRPVDWSLFLRDYRIAVDIFEQMQLGTSFEKAAYMIAESYNVSDSTAEKAYKRHCRHLKAHPNIEAHRRTIENATRPIR